MSTTAKTNKSDGSRMNIFYIIHVLEKFSDEEHPLSAADIAKLVSQEFGEKSGRMVTVSVDTVKRTMSSLIDTFFYNDTQVRRLAVHHLTQELFDAKFSHIRLLQTFRGRVSLLLPDGI